MLCKAILLSKSFWFQATGPFDNVNIMLIKKFCIVLVISYHLIINSKHDVTIIETTLVGKKRFHYLPKISVVSIPLLVILEKYCFIDFFRVETHLLRWLLYSFSLTSEGFLIYLFLSLLLV